MNVIVRVDSSLEIGTGHVMRCLSIAEGLQENGVNVEFICREFRGNLIEKIQSRGFKVFVLNACRKNIHDDKISHAHWLGASQLDDARECIEILKYIQPEWLIVDHYGIGGDWHRKLNIHCDKLMVIDDLADRDYQCDLLLDQTFGRKEEDYKTLVPDSCELLLGSQFAILRPEFLKWRQYSLERRSKPEFKKLLINMGGVDSENVTEEIISELTKCHLPSEIEIIIVMGESSPHLERVKARINDLPYKVEIKVNVDNMAEIMAKSDIAIGASGASTWERCFLGLPSIQIVVADNQTDIAKLLANKNAIRVLECIGQLKNVLEEADEWMENTTNIATQILDGMGTGRVVNKIVDKKL